MANARMPRRRRSSDVETRLSLQETLRMYMPLLDNVGTYGERIMDNQMESDMDNEMDTIGPCTHFVKLGNVQFGSVLQTVPM